LAAELAIVQEEKAGVVTDFAGAREAWGVAESALQATQTMTQEELSECKKKAEDLTASLESFKEHAGVGDADQLQKLVELSKRASFLEKQLCGASDIAAELQQATEKLEDVTHKLFHAEGVRRLLHNQIQELRGNVRVHVRVRPSMDVDGNTSAVVDCKADKRTVLIGEGGEKDHKFAFDHVFDQSTTQANIFDEVSPLVQSSLDGFNVCLFSYGQTGSGKTFTMQGSNMGDNRGIIPRSIEKIMEEAGRLENAGWKYTLEVTFLEIYNETVRDLLTEGNVKADAKGLQILMNPDGGSHVPDLNRMAITDNAQIGDVMKRAAKHRSVACTQMNSESSRSHSVFTLHLKGVNEKEGVTIKGSLNLCDLAGSERLDRSGATGDRLKETQAINKSLSCLADVFQSLVTKSTHVPYRNSKLTYLLQQCFSEQGKTMMMVNLSPSVESQGESLCSLRFAAKVNQTELGKPNKQIKSTRRMSVADAAPPLSKRKKV
jgi:kinesin family protein C1